MPRTWVAQYGCSFQASVSPQSQYPPPTLVLILYLQMNSACLIWSLSSEIEKTRLIVSFQGPVPSMFRVFEAVYTQHTCRVKATVPAWVSWFAHFEHLYFDYWAKVHFCQGYLATLCRWAVERWKLLKDLEVTIGIKSSEFLHYLCRFPIAQEPLQQVKEIPGSWGRFQ